jgi:hypothetical protein
MRYLPFLAVTLVPLLWAGDKKVEPGVVSSDEVEVTASLLSAEESRQALGLDLPKGVVAVQVRVRPKGDKALKIDRDDFVLLNSNDGQRSTPFAPTQIAGTGGLTLQSKTMGGWAAQGNAPIWGGVGGPPRQSGPSNGGSLGSQTAQPQGVEAKVKEGENKGKEDPMLGVLRAKGLPEKPTQEAVSGLLYFPLEGKPKLKHISLFYKAPSSKLELRFAR